MLDYPDVLQQFLSSYLTLYSSETERLMSIKSVSFGTCQVFLTRNVRSNRSKESYNFKFKTKKQSFLVPELVYQLAWLNITKNSMSFLLVLRDFELAVGIKGKV
ncbi:hypothetical protein NADFUDRAFT_53785 [Nadsonia fulvescens var. elongata DSM 6958]|uniref:Uncharacterized protein n=1 Tax=Nadsonia fulvescens var. elongata DSM 6958 TaxID=857566 RepID=A0A1E3PCJ7_9ASCO|nr:hypothetical protein NADFUDRAFT_53785 [Nadsonia fulvescens var. elongata DSM 6958]